MKSRWSDSEANQTIEQYAEQGVSGDLALRVYTSRLLGQDHPDWDEYDRAMVKDRRAAVVVVPDHVYGTAL